MSKIINEEIFYEILDKLHVSLYIVDEEGRLQYINNAAVKLDHLDKESDVGRKLSDVWGANSWEGMMSPTLDALQNGRSHLYDNLEWRLVDGTTVNAITSSYPIIRNGNIVGAYTLAEDIAGLRRHLIRQGAFKRKQVYKLKKGILKNGTEYIFEDIIGSSAKIKESISFAQKLATKSLPVFIYGETGCGKEMFAQSIHNASPRAAEPFVAINCAAIPETLLESMLFGTVKGAFTGASDREGIFEKAGNGTIFLDEINSMPIVLQAKILRVIQQKEIQRLGSNKTKSINCRILSAANKDPFLAISDGEFREDLYYRLAMGVVWLPPLRERLEDINELVDYFIAVINNDMDMNIIGATDEFLQLLKAYKWQGNIRELMNVLSNSVFMLGENEIVLDVEHLPKFMIKTICDHLAVDSVRNSGMKNVELAPASGNINEMVDAYEYMLIQSAIESSGGKLSAAAEKLQISRQALYVKMKKHKISREK